MSDESGQVGDRLHKQRLVKAARMYAMCQKAEIPEPDLQISLALAAFEEMPLQEASAFVRTNKPNLEDMAWALRNSNSPEEFEAKLRERVAAMSQRAGQTRKVRGPSPGVGRA